MLFRRKYWQGNNKGQLNIIIPILTMVVAIVVIVGLTSVLSIYSISSAIDYLTNRGYVVFAVGEYTSLSDRVDEILLNISNETFIFPEETNVIITLQAGGVANTFGNWVEIVDGNAVKLSSKFATTSGYLSEINTEGYSIKGERYMIEVAYGATKQVIARTRVKAEAIGATQFVYYLGLKSEKIPAGEIVYYRMKAETAGATLECSFRYYYE